MNNMQYRGVYPPVEATESWWGIVRTDRITYKPLDEIIVSLEAPLRGAKHYQAELYDGAGRRYAVRQGYMVDGKACLCFTAGSVPGMQYIKVWFDPVGEDALHDRLVNIYVEACTRIDCGDEALSAMYEYTKGSMLLNRRKYSLPEGRVIGYTTADSGNNLDFWMRDMFYNMGGFQFWENDLTSGFQALWARQYQDGHFPDWVNETGLYDRMTSESDVEYIAVLALERVWLVTGDDAWLLKNLPAVEKGLQYLTSDPVRWDTGYGLVKRGHTCDTWDFDIDTDFYVPENSAVAAVCDQSGLYAAFKALSRIYHYLEQEEKADHYGREADLLKERCCKFLWDGEKFRHHLHIKEFDHKGFDESEQLAMGNGWAMTRGLADRDSCTQILETYRKRWEKTGHRFPWWSLEPGYPLGLGKVLTDYADYLQPGGYANGGMMPWVGAALSLSAFRNGQEGMGFRLLKDYACFLKDQGGKIYTWYWPDMQPGFRTTTRNTTGHDGWSMGHWMDSLVEGLAGFQIMEPGMDRVELSPRWEAGGIKSAQVILHLPAVDRYVAYRYTRGESGVNLHITGTARCIDLRLMVPYGWTVLDIRVNGLDLPLVIEKIINTEYVLMRLQDQPIWEISLRFK